MLIRSHLSSFAFDASVFRELCAQLRSGALGPERCRLSTKPAPLPGSAPYLLEPYASHEEQRQQWAESGLDALRQGEVAVLVLSGGMATRFGGGAKGCFALRTGHPRPTFLSLKLAQLAQLVAEHQAKVPVLVMDSFATRPQVQKHLEELNWMGLPAPLRGGFSQSILPRVCAKTHTPLIEKPDCTQWPDSVLYCAPGHGDTLLRLRDSGTLDKLRSEGVRHLLISNVDNLLASLDPVMVGAHLQGVARNCQVSIEAVPRRPQEAGGCVAQMTHGPAIVESFRLPASTQLDDYPDFNTNTLWVDLRALDPLPTLQWHPVHRQILAPNGESLECVQFEQLIGELSEHRPSQVLRVPREQRFLPIKRREDLLVAAPQLDPLIDRWNTRNAK